MKPIKQNNPKSIFILFSFFFLLNANAQYVSTFAGSGVYGYSNGTGTEAHFYSPFGVAIDATANVYVGDYNNNVIRKITAAGEVSTLAGGAFFGDGTFYGPTGVAVDAAGNVYVADTFYHRVRKITAAGEVSTLAGGTQGYAEGTGAAAQFDNPRGVAVDAGGNVFVVDSWNHRIRKITPAGVVSTLAGSTVGYADGTGVTAQFFGPCGVAVDTAGNVFVADEGNNRIRKITAAGVVSTLAGSTLGFADGTGTAALFNQPFGLAVDAAGNIFVADRNNNRIRKITAAGAVTTLAGSTPGYADGPGAAALFNYPSGVAVDAAGTVFVADINNHRIRKITTALATPNYHQNQVSVYPNPASSIINIELEDITAAKVIIFDINARALQTQNIIDNRGTIDISSLANGIYLLQIATDKGTVYKKIMKE